MSKRASSRRWRRRNFSQNKENKKKEKDKMRMLCGTILVALQVLSVAVKEASGGDDSAERAKRERIRAYLKGTPSEKEDPCGKIKLKYGVILERKLSCAGLVLYEIIFKPSLLAYSITGSPLPS